MSVADAGRRTLAPPARRVCEVVASRRLGSYRLLTALDTKGPADPRPGQFYMLASASEWGGGAGERPYLPRAFSWAQARAADGGIELDFLLEDVGPGTHRLDGLAGGDGLAIVGPLGIGFGKPDPGTEPVLVGGGIGAAPILCLAQELGTAAVILGFRDAPHAEAASLFESPVVVTDDGSTGGHGLVTEPLRAKLDRLDGAATVYACGPPAMLEAVRALCAQRGVGSQLVLESGMACGYGACFGCVVPTRDGFVRLCVDGPVLRGEDLDTAFVSEAHSG